MKYYAETADLSQQESYLVPNTELRGIGIPYATATDYYNASALLDPTVVAGDSLSMLSIPSPIQNKYIQLPDGSVTGPALSFSGEVTSGRYRIGTNNIGESIGGDLKFDWNATRMRFDTGFSLQLGDLTSGSVLFAGASGAISQNNASFFWDNTRVELKLTEGSGTDASYSVQTITYSGTGLTTQNAFRVKRTGSPYEYDLLLRTSLFCTTGIICSGTVTGSGTTYAISPPSADALMFGAFSDVNGPCYQGKGSGLANSRIFEGLDSSGNYRFSVLDNGTLRWGASTFAAQDVTMSRFNSNTLQTNGNFRIPNTFSYTLLKADGVNYFGLRVTAGDIIDFSGGSAFPSEIQWFTAASDGLDIQASGVCLITGASSRLSIGSTPATGGTIRLANAAAISWRNAANSQNIGIGVDGTDVLQTGLGTVFPTSILLQTSSGDVDITPGSNIARVVNGTAAQELRVFGNTTGSKYLSLKHDGTNAVLSASSGTFNVTTQMLATSSLSVGTSPYSSTGNIRLPNATFVGWRNSGNTTDIGFGLASDNIVDASRGSAFPSGWRLEVGTNDGIYVTTGAHIVTGSSGFVFNEAQGDFDFRIEGDSISHLFFTDATATTENIAVFATAAPNWQTMDRGFFIGDTSTAPTGNPASGGFLYSNAGAGTWRGSGGTTTTFAAAGPHCGECGYDFWEVCCTNERWGAELRKCGWCGKVYKRGPKSVLDLLTSAQKAEILNG